MNNASSPALQTGPRWEQYLRSAGLVIIRVGLAYLFFTQLFWKLPPTFGCPDDFSFTTGGVQEGRVQLQRTSGLCDWIGIQSVWADQRRLFFVTDINPRTAPEIAVDLSWAARLNGIFIDNVVKPNIRWFGWIIWGSEAFIFVSLFFGILSRLGGLVAIGISGQLMISLAGITNPHEWEWAYNQMVLLSIAAFALAPGRVLGFDALLRKRLQPAAAEGNPIARVLLLAT